MDQNILFTCAGRRNYLINYFKKALNGQGHVIAADEQKYAPALAEADIAIEVPNIYNENYISNLLEIVDKHAVSAIISLNDLELPILAENKDVFLQHGAKVIISDPSIIALCFDKWETYKFIKKLKLNTPKSYIHLEKAIKDIEDGKLKFPLVLKPRWGSGSDYVFYPESIEELKLGYKLQIINLKKNKSINNRLDMNDNLTIIQEKLDGTEYGMDILNNFDGEYYGSFAKEKLAMRSGETDRAKSIIDDKFEKLGEKVGNALKHIGNLDCDLFLVKDKLFLLELNPRFGGGYPFSHEAGIDIAGIYVEWLNGSKYMDFSQYNNYKENMVFSKCDRLIKNS